jgi:poly-gamma-glutamate synthesis protein (capsule biosynthesis protein)
MAEAPESQARAPFTLAFTGDVMLGRGVQEVIRQRGFDYPWGDLLPLLRGVDLLCINLECVLTRVTERWHGDPGKPFFFRADPAAVQTLRSAGVRCASLANNHIGDFGREGLLETVDVLDEADIAHAGAGADLAAARAAARLSVQGWRVAVVAFADHPRAWRALKHSPGLNHIQISPAAADFTRIERTLGEVRRQADLVVFSIHWGPNMRAQPAPEFRAFARLVMAAGADIFWGHSAHVVQGIELVEGKPIFYDTGDFVDDYAVDPELRNDLSALFLLRVRPPLIERIELVPVCIRHRCVSRAQGAERALLAQRLTQACSEFGTTLADGPDGLVVRYADGPAVPESR